MSLSQKSPRQIVVLGGGFAGLWSAVGAARKLDECAVGPDDVQVTLVNRDAFHGIRVRNYEADLSAVRVPLDEILSPISVRSVVGDIVGIDLSARVVKVAISDGQRDVPYDRLVFALGSQLSTPDIPGLKDFAFNVDTYDAALKLQTHIRSLKDQPDRLGRLTVLVVGGGLTGIETAMELPARLAAAVRPADQFPPRVLLVDHKLRIGSDMGDSAVPVIEQKLQAAGVESKAGLGVTSVTAQGAVLSNGEFIEAQTVIWCAGMKANPLTALFPVEKDRLGRIPVDEFLRVTDVPDIFAAGDSAWMLIDGKHASVMSCQHARPMGRFAGHNVVCDLLGLPMQPLNIDWYVTVLDLGEQGALYTEGWDRHVVATGATAKSTKQEINCRRIYPPLDGNRESILAAAAPIVQRPPAYSA